MDAYSEVGAVYFSVADRTAFAKYQVSEIIRGSYIGHPPYQEVKNPLSEEHKKYHTAEHQVYNSFMNKIRNLNKHSDIQIFKNYIPSLEEARREGAFSLLCGTTISISSVLILISSIIVNYLNYHFKLNDYACLSLFITSLIFSLITIFYIQKNFYLTKPDDKHLVLALEALKEIIK